MSRGVRRRRTATVKRVTRKKDTWGGIGPVETDVVTGYKFYEWNVTPFDRESIVTRYGLESDAVIYFGEGAWNASILNGDVLHVSTSVRFKVIGTHEMYGMNPDTPVALALTLQLAGRVPT